MFLTPSQGKVAINNHVDITVVYGQGKKGIVIIGFEVLPSSIRYNS